MDTKQYETRLSVEEPIIEAYAYGSTVYGCNTEKSDTDYIVVVESDEDLYYSVNLERMNTNITVYSEPLFIKKIKEHHISIMECIFQREDDPYRKYFELDLAKLRRAISSVSSNSFVKCKKKLAEGEVYIGKKSLFHSLRILLKGIDIAENGKITNYGVANHFLSEIMDEMPDDWNILKTTYQPVFNRLKSEFRKLAPLEGELNVSSFN
jgi:predicted nucleotidyltransferase